MTPFVKEFVIFLSSIEVSFIIKINGNKLTGGPLKFLGLLSPFLLLFSLTFPSTTAQSLREKGKLLTL